MDASSKEETYKAIQYKAFAHLENEHAESATITAVAFSPDVLHLACAGDDGKISIWDTRTGKLLYVFVGGISMLSITWINSKQVVSGMRNGMIFVGTVDKVALELTALTFFGHEHAISCANAQEDGVLCATGAGNEIKIWRPQEKGIGQWDESQCVVLPSRSGAEVRVDDLCWGHRHWQLFAVYLHHGVVLWDISNGNILHRLENVRSQYISLAPPESTTPNLLAISNATSGFDIYNFDRMCWEPSATSLDCDAQRSNSAVSLPVLQIHGGSVIVGGSLNGRVCLRDAKSPTHKAIQILRHIDPSPVTGLAFAYDFYQDNFFIATVTKRHDNAPIVYVWRSQDKEKHIKETPHRIRNGYEWTMWGFAGVLFGLMCLVISGFLQNKRRV